MAFYWLFAILQKIVFGQTAFVGNPKKTDDSVRNNG
jgi:hypothetical protein